jgi:hypothetical protein
MASVLHSTADIARCSRQVSKVPNSDFITLFTVLAEAQPLLSSISNVAWANLIGWRSGCSIPSDILPSCYEVGSPTIRPCCKD